MNQIIIKFALVNCLCLIFSCSAFGEFQIGPYGAYDDGNSAASSPTVKSGGPAAKEKVPFDPANQCSGMTPDQCTSFMREALSSDVVTPENSSTPVDTKNIDEKSLSDVANGKGPTAEGACTALGGFPTKGGGCSDTCLDDYTSASSICDPFGTLSSMDGSALGLLASGGLNTLGSAATMGSSNQAQACGLAAYISGAAATIQAAQGGTCLIKVSSCMDSCKRATGASGTGSKITKGSSSGIAAKHLSECNAMHRLGLADIQQSLQNAASTASSLACANAASGLATNYALPNGAQDCSNPVYAAQSTYCICLSNPRDVRCLANAGQAGGLNGALGTSGGLNGAAGIDPSAYQGDTGPAFADRSAAPAGGPQAPQAMGGSGMGPSSPSGPAPAGEGDGATPNGNVASILGNSTGGSGAFSYGKSDSSKDGGGLGGMLSKLKKFNFGGLLPNKDKIQRGVAGGGADGITGANGPSIWEKVSTQYQKKKSELLP